MSRSPEQFAAAWRSGEFRADDLRVMKGLSIEDLDEELVETYLRRTRRRDSLLRNRSDAEVLRMTSILTASDEPTLAGLYALGCYPQGAEPALSVTAAVQLPGGEGMARTQNLQDFTGPIPTLLTEVLEWVATNIDTVQQYQLNGHMSDVSEFPLNAIRELLSNALVHRDLGTNTLGLGKSIQLRLTPRVLIILSPGGLRGVSLAQIESTDHAQAAVNQHLYQIAKRLRASDGEPIIEGEGGGIGEVFRSFEGRGLPRPLLIDTGLEFKAVLWRERD